MEEDDADEFLTQRYLNTSTYNAASYNLLSTNAKDVSKKPAASILRFDKYLKSVTGDKDFRRAFVDL
jgi:hypothetical protein